MTKRPKPITCAWCHKILTECQCEPVAPPPAPHDLHPDTKQLVIDFAAALANKLCAAEKKCGYSDGWTADDWMDECRAKLREHIEKGDPLDVAAYCAFLWHHKAPTTSPSPVPQTERELSTPNIDAALQGCVSGHISEWPAIRTEILAVRSRLAANEAGVKEAHEALDVSGIAKGAFGHSVRYRIGLLIENAEQSASRAYEAAAKLVRPVMTKWLNLTYDQRAYSWHEMQTVIKELEKAIRKLAEKEKP